MYLNFHDLVEMLQISDKIFLKPVKNTWKNYIPGHDRMKACRGVGASLSDEELLAWENEHKELLMEKAPEKFEVRHYAALAMLKKK